MELLESQDPYRAAFEAAAVGIGRLDLEGSFLEANPALERMLGVRLVHSSARASAC
jgi:PAS domain S-box-containing protein